MERRYVQAIKAGLVCGVIISVIYLVISIAGLWLNSTPAMKSYNDQLTQPVKNMLENGTYNYSYTYKQYNQPSAPVEYYIAMALSMLNLAVEVIGLFMAGVFAIRMVGQTKYSIEDSIGLGAIAGISAYVPLFIAMFIMSIVSMFTSTMGTLYSIMPALSMMLPVITICNAFCCCLPVGIVISAVLGVVGAFGYVLVIGKLERQARPV